MSYSRMTKKDLLAELSRLQRKVSRLEKRKTGKKPVENNLRTSQETFEVLFNSMLDFGWVLDMEGCIQAINPVVTERLGYSESELLGQNLLAVHPPDQREEVTEIVADVISGKIAACPVPLQAKDGTQIPVETRVTRGRIGDTELLFGISRDVSYRRQAEEEVQKLAEVVRHSSELVNLATLDGQMMFLNQAGAIMLGIEPSQVQNTGIMEVIPDHLKEIVVSDIVPTLQAGRTWEGELQYLNLETDEIRDVHAMTFAIKDQSTGDPLYLANVSRDITEQKRAEKAIIKERNRVANILEGTNAGTWDWNVQTGAVIFNERWAQIIGKTLKELEPISIQTWLDNVHPDDLPAAQAALERHFNGKADYYDVVFRQPHKEGGWVWVNARGKVVQWTEDNKPLRMSGTHLDITERKQAEEELRRYEHIVSSSNDMLALLDRNFVYLAANDAYARAFRKVVDDIVGHTPSEVFGDEYFTNAIKPRAEKCLMGHETRYQDWVDFPAYGRRYMEITYYPYFGLGGGVDGLVVNARDATERKRVEEALRESEERLDLAVKGTGAGIWDWNVQTGETVFNQRWAGIVGYKLEELEPISIQTWMDLCHPDDLAQSAKLPEEHFEGTSERYVCEARMRHKDGHWIWVLDQGKVVEWDSDGKPLRMLGTHIDITDQKMAAKQQLQLKERLEKAERMESLGILAGGVAHDLNNMLGPLVGYPDLMLRSIPADSTIGKQIQRMGDSARNAASVIQDLLTLARRGRYEMEPTDLNEVIEAYLDSPNFAELRRKQPDISLKINLDQDANPVMGSRPHLSKMVMNLVVNAFDAMLEGGTLSITITQRYVRSLIRGYKGIKHGDYTILRISDTGMGINPDDLEKIFEPYYSKKTLGVSGSGLGLAVVYGIVKDHNAYYDVISEPGHGAEFILYFPIVNEAVKSISNSQAELQGTESVLVVDDAEEQRAIANDMLSSLGYQVKTASSGQEAVSYLNEHSVDLVMLDMIMEDGFDGLDTYREIIKQHPGQKAMVVSGFSATDRVEEMQKLGAGLYVRKPYTLRAIGAAVRQELDRKPHADQAGVAS